MYLIRSLTIISIFLLVSCGEGPKKNLKSETELPIEGFWERKGTIQFVNGVPVDTLLYDIDDTGEEKGFRNIKVYSKGNVLWVNNAVNKSDPYGAQGGYGKFNISKDTLTEFMSHGCGGFGPWLKYNKDSLKISAMRFPFGYYLSDQNYTQLGGRVPNSDDNIRYGEYYEKLPPLRKSKMDGVWKRAYEISYVNGVAVDTTKVPADAVLDLKIIQDGYFMVVVDQTNLIKDVNDPWHGGFLGYGQIDYDGKGNMVEYNEFGSGAGVVNNFPPRNASTAHYASVSFYDDDMYLQITKDTLDRPNPQAGRGVVYRRVQ
ncbi:MAG: hypothetical protein VX325_02825 [Bacteroidota bacterium]|nr:hypothetical protein [Bacteroidota bacterium]